MVPWQSYKFERRQVSSLPSTDENVLVYIGTGQIQNSSSEKLLGVKIDCKINFKDHRGSICKKTSA